MKATRRSVLKAGVTLAAVASAAPALSRARARTVVFDSRIPESLAFAQTMAAARLIDIANADATRWADIRAIAQGPIAGLTAWSDWVALRGLFEERGLRARTEAPVNAALSRRNHLFRWAMA